MTLAQAAERRENLNDQNTSDTDETPSTGEITRNT